eukprot:CAMPEP_0179074350 /NCGR_PEP_ID=MMETSP0796-20121207/33042_1 /TAXON_ID=73915 /ORGANISM="Pyrodinium bahamense, Strain pbaha01" /LENGTH=81 /DNA_ID=CAMNT_0020771573 /DNA_START=196 /DNA_END=441 /DNA_ORIENTATION=+
MPTERSESNGLEFGLASACGMSSPSLSSSSRSISTGGSVNGSVEGGVLRVPVCEFCHGEAGAVELSDGEPMAAASFRPSTG